MEPIPELKLTVSQGPRNLILIPSPLAKKILSLRRTEELFAKKMWAGIELFRRSWQKPTEWPILVRRCAMMS